jgi:pimeloyl-ACP methyl ester carboxylesterase
MRRDRDTRRSPPSRASRIGRTIAGLVSLALLVPFAFRLASCARESHPTRLVAPRRGTFVDVGDVDLYRQEVGPRGGRPIVFVPGTMAWSGTYRPLMERMADEGYRAIGIDLPPFGFAERPDDHDYSRAAQARRIAAFFDLLDLRDAILVGHSFGGGATMEAALTIRGRVTALALFDVALRLEDEVPTGPPLARVLAIGPVRNALVASTLTNPLLTGLGLRAFVHDGSIVTTERIGVYHAPLAVEGTTEAVGEWITSGLYRDERRSESGPESAYRAYARPVLVVWGREDTITPLAEGQHIAGLLPHAELAVLDGVGHIPHLEDVDAVAERLLAFARAH